MTIFWLCYGEYQGNRGNARAFLTYVLCRIKQHEQEVAYRFYMSDFLYYMGKGMVLEQRYRDIAFSTKKVDTRSADEIALDVIKRAGLKVE